MGATKTEGERWTEELLTALRRDRFAPTAWIRFFGASVVRARENRSAHTVRTGRCSRSARPASVRGSPSRRPGGPCLGRRL
ncbi:MAG: hypothetical protein LC729_03615 [Acidobacteria bacterium]|nr:hypothetical protein [Acidobacteriota bacterium]